MKYRKRLQIIADMISVAIKHPKRLQIMYEARLSYGSLLRYLNETTNAGLIIPEEDEHYSPTRKGELYLKRSKRYSRMLKLIEEIKSKADEEKQKLERMLAVS